MFRLKEYKKPQEDFHTQKFNPQRVVVPFVQHTGVAAEPVVAKGDKVEPGSLLGEASSLISSRVHSPVAGEVRQIGNFNHPLFKRVKSCFIDSQEKADFVKQQRKNVDRLLPEEILNIVKQAGIVGLGGACFPSHVKLNPPKKIDILIVNACECEPYLVCDHRLMLEEADLIIKGVELVSRVIQPERVIFAFEENKKQAIKRFNSKLHIRKYKLPPFSVSVLPAFYPQGAEKQLIYKTTRRVVPSGKIPFETGCLVHNVATLFSIAEAVYYNKPLMERIVTFAGSGIKEPKNFWVKTGTLISEFFSQGVIEPKGEIKKVVFGGPMMGVSLDSLDYPVIKGTSGVLFLTQDDLDLSPENSCIKCARCVDVCPMNLLPLEYARLVKGSYFKELTDYNINDCMECGLCSYVCPAKIPLVNYIKAGKDKLKTIK
jgi:Na+-translocating ferredoxin:NAD+ oxidoreductase subunit C